MSAMTALAERLETSAKDEPRITPAELRAFMSSQSGVSRKIWENLLDIENSFPSEELILQHRRQGVPMYFTTPDMPEGRINCMMPDGTITPVE